MADLITDQEMNATAVIFDACDMSAIRKQEKENKAVLDTVRISVDGRVIREFSRRDIALATIRFQPFF